MQSQRRKNALLTATILLLLAVSYFSFRLSFFSLMGVAEPSHGAESYNFPWCIDLAILTFGVSAVIMRLLGKSVVRPMLALWLATVLSVALNIVAHVDFTQFQPYDDSIQIIVSFVPPVFLALGIDTILSLIEVGVSAPRNEAEYTSNDVEKAEVGENGSSPSVARVGAALSTRDVNRIRKLREEGASIAETARRVGVSKSTVSRYSATDS